MNEMNKPFPGKKAYQAPCLRVYGDVRSITQATGAISKQADGGTGKANKT